MSKTRPYIVGIDPGAEGAITVLDFDGTIKYSALLGSTLISMFEILGEAFFCEKMDVFLEKVHAMPGQGVSSMFKFGMNYGRVEAAIFAIHTTPEPHYVYPSVWTKAIHRSKAKTAKQRSIETALELWPEETFIATRRSRKPHQGLVDSALIAEYGRRSLRGMIKRAKRCG